MQILNPKINYQLLRLCLTLAFLTATVSAQTTVFNFQGRLNDGTNPANGNVEMQFKLFSALSGGSQIGATVSQPGVVVINGIFTTQLDFGAAAFDGSARFVEIGVRPAGNTNPFTVLNPRQAILSTPYAIQAKNAQQLGGLDASQYVTTTTVGNSFIKNATTQQTGNFNISGSGIVGNSLGIGVTPSNGYKLDVSGQANFRTGGITGGGIVFGTPNGETGYTIYGTNSTRADMRFDGLKLRLLVGPGNGGPPSSTNGISIDQSGIVSVGGDFSGIHRLGVIAGAGVGLEVISDSDTALVATNFSMGGRAASFYGTVQILTLDSAGSTPLCLNSRQFIANCSSSLRYKKDLQPFGEGLSFINKLNPIAYKWKSNDLPDIGFGAEDMAKINPLFVTYNSTGEVEGVKYDRLSIVFVNAFKEQQKQIEQQQKQIENLTKLICLDHPNAALCQEK